MAANTQHSSDSTANAGATDPPLISVKQNLHRADKSTRLLFDRVRLAIVTTLAIQTVMAFPELARSLDVTDGNLSTHARKLEDAGLIKSAKRFKDRKPRTEYRITSKGRKALQRYLDHMEAIIHATRSAQTTPR